MTHRVSDFAERQHFLTPIERSRQNEQLVREQRRRAVLHVCQAGHDVDDVRALLDVLGLDPREGLREPPAEVTAAVPVGAIRATTSWNDPGRTETRRKK